jgi:hypothetical protein
MELSEEKVDNVVAMHLNLSRTYMTSFTAKIVPKFAFYLYLLHQKYAVLVTLSLPNLAQLNANFGFLVENMCVQILGKKITVLNS